MIIINKLLSMIEKDSLQLARRWKKEMLESEYTDTYKKISEKELIKRGELDFVNLGEWIDGDIGMEEIGKVYINIGRERFIEGFALSEILYAFHCSKKLLWNYILSSGILTSALEIYQAMDLIVRVYNFYDIAAFYVIRGYQQSLFAKLARCKKGIDVKTLKDIFPLGYAFAEKGEDKNLTEDWVQSWNLFKTK